MSRREQLYRTAVCAQRVTAPKLARKHCETAKHTRRFAEPLLIKPPMASVSLQGGEVDVSVGMQQQVHACPVPLLSLPESFNGSPDRVQDGSCRNAGGTSTGQGDQLYGADTTAREPAPSEASLPQPQPHSPTIKRGAISTRFRAERAIVAMAQRAVSWRGPELWLVTGASRLEVKLGPPLRDLHPWLLV